MIPGQTTGFENQVVLMSPSLEGGRRSDVVMNASLQTYHRKDGLT